jgi:protein gp37
MQRLLGVSLRAHFDRAGVAFFFKQWGGVNKKAGRLLQGREYNAMPGELPSVVEAVAPAILPVMV